MRNQRTHFLYFNVQRTHISLKIHNSPPPLDADFCCSLSLSLSLSLSPLFLGSVLNVQHFPNDNFLFLSTSSSSSFSIFPQTRIGGQSTSVKRNLTHWQNKKQKQLGSRWKMWKYICLHQTNHQSWFSPFVFLKVILLLNYAPFNKTLDKKNQ